MKSMKSLLLELNLIESNRLDVFSKQTRDKENLTVFRDPLSGIIFIDGFMTEKEVYQAGSYRDEGIKVYGKRDYEVYTDVARRIKDYKQFYVGKNVLDFGCGEGTFLRGIKDFTIDICGLEIQTGYIKKLNANGINCFNSFEKLKSLRFDTIFCFHTLEHLYEPIEILKEFKTHLKPGGILIVEVPHAKDFLLSNLKNEDFKNFTLWSQHLILHTRESLQKFLRVAGFDNLIIQARQRYPLSNHLNWMKNKKPGGHKSLMSIMDTHELTAAYERSLQMIDSTDTLIAIAQNT